MKDNRASATARLIARSTVFLSCDPAFDALISPKAVQACSWFSGLPAERLTRLCQSPRFRAFVRSVERRILPGILNHYILRKRFIEDAARDCFADGVRQMVVFGAGFDTLALRFSGEWLDAAFFEVDHPATQRVKSDAFPPECPIPNNLCLIPTNFSDANWPRALLSSPRYDANADTFFVAEGLLMYLPLPRVESLFDFVRNRSGPRSRFAFTFLEPQSNGAPNFEFSSRLVDFWLRLRGEPFRWGISSGAMPQFLSQHGLELRELRDAQALQNQYLTPEKRRGKVNGDLACLASRRD